jgi:hypothetical protein
MSRPLRAITLLCGLASAACLADLEPDVGEPIAGQCKSADSDPDVDVSFSDDIFPILDQGCGCHSPKSTSPGAIESTGFSVASFATIMRGGQKSGTQIVVAEDPCASQLYQKCSEAPPYGSRMPLYGPYLSPSQLAVLHDWIAEGAREN